MRDRSRPANLAKKWTECAWLFHGLSENLEQCLLVLDHQSRCLAANSRFCRWLKRPYSEIRGRHLADFWPYPLSHQETATHERILRGEWIEGEEESLHSRQTSFLRIRKAPLRDAEGDICGMLFVFREVPVAPSPEALHGQTARWESLGRLTTAMLRDLDNLLKLMGNALAMLQTSMPPGLPPSKRATLQNTVTEATSLMNRLCQLARGRSGDLRSLDSNPETATLAPSTRLLEKTILLVEPDRSVAVLTTSILSQWGCKVLCSEDGCQAMKMYCEQHEEIDLVLVEEELAGQPGWELVNDLLAIKPHLAVLLVGVAGPPTPSWSTATSKLRFLRKPYTPEQLRQCIGSLSLGERPA